MVKDIDYRRILDLIHYIQSLDQELINKIKTCFKIFPQKESVDLKNRQIHVPALAQLIHENKLFKSFVPNISDHIPLDVFLHLTVHQYNFRKSSNYKTVLDKIRSIPIYNLTHQIHNDLEFISLMQALIGRKTSWAKFTYGFNGNDWQEIHLLSEILPVSNIVLNEFVAWISIIIEKQSKDLALNTITKYIYEWVIRSKTVYMEIDHSLAELAVHNSLNLFLGPLLKGIKEKQEKDNKYYISKLKNIIEEGNAYRILHSLGTISLNNKTSKDFYYGFLLKNLRNKNLRLSEFINLCSIFQLYRPTLFSKVDAIIKDCENVDELRSVIHLLDNENNEIDFRWKLKTSFFLFAKNVDPIKSDLDHFLISIADRNLNQAYELFEARMKIMAHTNMLEDAFIHMVQKDVPLFQSKLINWLNQEDLYLHLAVRKICSLQQLGKTLFDIPSDLFVKYNNKDRLYIIYKIAGFVYSMEALQRLILSVIKSIVDGTDILKQSIYSILSDYLIYNYRSTLELIQNTLVEDEIKSFGKKLFNEVNDFYKDYFVQLKNNSVDKELRPYEEYLLLKRFYMKKQFSDLPKNVRQNSIMKFFKETAINSNKWAIRRPNQLKHEVKNLGHISVTSEFPSGEYLNPIQQEAMRKSYQKIRKNEININ